MAPVNYINIGEGLDEANTQRDKPSSGSGYLSQYDHMLNNLTKSLNVDTKIDVIKIIITYDS